MKTKIFKFYLLCADENLNTLVCTKCDLENDISVIKLTLGQENSVRRFRTYNKPYQCQDCGKIHKSDQEINLPGEIKLIKKGTCVALKDLCDCGGQFRRDKNFFCIACHARKTKENKAETHYHIYKKTLDKLFFNHLKI